MASLSGAMELPSPVISEVMPLIDFRGQARIDENRQFRLTQHVDETRSNDFSASVDRALAGRGREIADGGNFSVADSDVSGVPRASRCRR